jgi:hypothetical protein
MKNVGKNILFVECNEALEVLIEQKLFDFLRQDL